LNLFQAAQEFSADLPERLNIHGENLVRARSPRLGSQSIRISTGASWLRQE